MIGKIVTGKSFKGAVEYVMNKEHARLLTCDGVDDTDARSVTDSFNFQRKARPEIAKVVGHISLSFHPDDAPKLTDEMMIRLAGEYMLRMGITDTQYIVARHHDTGHPHIHILYNRVRYDRKLVPDNNERRRNTKVCKALKQKYGLTFSEGKKKVKTGKLHGPEQTKYAIYEAVKSALPGCRSLEALAGELERQGIVTTFVHRGGDTTKEVQGMTFTKDGMTFKASQIDRKFSYGNLMKTIGLNKAEADAQAMQQAEERRRQEQADEEARRKKEIEQRQRQEQKAAAERHRQEQTEEQAQPQPTEQHKPQPRTPQNPEEFGVRLTDKQVQRIRDGQYIYLENMRRDGEAFSGYFVADDKVKSGWLYNHAPDNMVQYGRFKMREMDRDLIERGYVVRAVVEWYGGGQTARPYLWKEKPSDTDYREAWSDPRIPVSEKREVKHVPSIPPKRKLKQGPK